MSTSSTVGFVHLHTHSEFSAIDSLAKVKDLVASAAADGNTALAITDHGTLGGLWKLGQYAAAAGIKPILGIEAYLAIGDRFEHNTVQVPDEDEADPDTDGGKGTKRKVYEHLTLLAATRQGWHNLVAMTNESHDSLWYKPRIDYDLLAKYAEGIIVLTGCLGGPVAGPLSRGDRATAVANLNHLIACVGKDNVYIEVMDHGIGAQLRIMDEMRSVAAELNLPLVATNDSHYLHANQQGAHDAWLAVGTRKRITDTDRFRFHGSGYHLRTEAEMRALQGGAPWWQEACDNTVAVASRISADVLPEPRLRLPKFPLPAGFTTGEYLHHLVREGAFERYGQDPDRPGRLPPSVNTQLKYEFGVISSAGLDDYFLIVHDVIAWARSDRGLPTVEFPLGEAGRKAPIRVGPGRGSSAGSTVSYCLKIVGVDPLANHLLFERFLNPERTGMPDIDVDFEQNRRPEVLRYIERRFGRDRVARIGTFGIAATRRAILDAARALGVTNLGEKLSPLVPIGGSGKPYSLKALADTTDKAGDAFRAAVVDAGEPAQEILAFAREFEGVTKLEGIHACGTLISDEPMASLVPLRRDLGKDATPEDLLVTVWDGKDVDSYGLLKMDVLGLRNLDVISAAVSFIQTTTGELIDPDTLIPNNPDDLERDAKVWDLIGSGRTAGVFQLNSPGITKLAEQIAPTSLNDLTALVALFRPGPLAAGMHEHYAARKNGREAVDYGYLTIDPAEQAAIASVLNDTYGVVAFQEELMRLSQVVGGLTPGMRNKLQKAFSKKSPGLMAEVKGAMFAGALAGDGTSGVKFKKATLERLWETFEGSASYLFNQCITGETVLENGKGIKWTVRDLYERLHGEDSSNGQCSRCHERPTVVSTGRCRRCDSWLTMFNDPTRGFSLIAHHGADGRLRPARVKDVHHKGEALVFKVSLSDGTSVRATEDHRFMAADTTYVKVSAMVPGSTQLLRDGGYERQTFKQEDRTTSGLRQGRPGKAWLPGKANCGYVDGGFLALKEWTEETRTAAACATCGRSDGRLERAHLDGNRRHNTPGNLAWMCPSDHKRHDYRSNGRPVRWDKGHASEVVTVVAVQLDGLEDVYDVEMEDGTDHNFTANGIVSHNSHACAYGFVTYVTAYLKANWPVQYGAALLAMTDDDDKRRLTIRSLQQEGISILAPDINRSGASTTPDGDAVRLGLSEVKGVGKNAGHIVTERDRGGGFASISDVLTRVKIPKDSDGRLGVVPVNVIEALIEVGAFDAFGPRMGQSMVLRAARAVPDIRPVDAEWGILERSARQRARLGLTTGEHPLIALCDQVREFTHRGVSPSPVQAAQRAKHGARVTLLGVLSSWDERAYRRGRMVSLTLEGSRESVEGVMWDEERAHLDVTPEVGHVVAVTARVQVRLVSTERVGDDGETISESFERRDLTVEQVVTVPVDDPSTLVLPEVADFVAPETSELDLDGSASTEVSLQGDFQDPPDVDAPEGVAPVWVGEYPPVVEPPGDDEWADPDPGGELSSTVDATPVPCPVPAADADQVVIRLPVRSLGRTHPDLLNAVTTHGVPAGFYGPAGGVWSVPTTDGRTLLVIVGEHTVPGAAHMDQQTTGWLSLNVPQNAAA